MLPSEMSSCKILVINFILVIILSSEVFCFGNYPLGNKPKPCSRKKAVITKTFPICIPQGKDGWTKQSADNCAGILKDQCPEFNQAECMWYTWKPAGCGHEVTLPCCRLKYFATKSLGKKYTWMEVFYANQYGTSDNKRTVFDIIEIHRFIKEPSAFPGAEQEDYPKNVLDVQGERGLKWVPLTMTSKNSISLGDQICGPTGKNLCTGVVKGLLAGQYPEGFQKPPPLTNSEKSCQAKVTFDHYAECSQALFNNVKSDVCKVTFIRLSTYSLLNLPEPINTWMPFLEAQVYTEKNGTGSNAYSMKIRYAYFNYEAQPEIKPSV
ncbi:hypothetical protein WDU94_010468 [Cyamophila willieti]